MTLFPGLKRGKLRKNKWKSTKWKIKRHSGKQEHVGGNIVFFFWAKNYKLMIRGIGGGGL
jgi:hypothetical protein